MDLKDILVASDFFNLTKSDIDEIVKELDMEVPQNVDEKVYLHSMKNLIFSNYKTQALIEKRALAGRTSVKWYTFNFESEEDKQELIKNLESEENYYNDTLEIDTSNLHVPRKYTCIKNGDNKYMIRVMVPTGTKTFNDGRTFNKITTVSNTITMIDLENNYIEVRSNSQNSKKIIDSIYKHLGIKNIIEFDIMGRYNGHIEAFKNSLFNGKFIDVTSKPVLDIKLSSEVNELLVTVLKAIDEYFIVKDIDKLKDELENLNIDDIESGIGSEEITFTKMLLAGMSKIGMGTRDDIEGDLSNQPLNSLLKEHMDDQSGFLTFTLDEQNTYTIQVGRMTNSISFRSMATEDAIEYIRGKILGH